jgi:hypothetical protein
LFLRPFLLTGIVMVWSRAIAPRSGRRDWFAIGTVSVLSVVAVILVGATYSFNRSSFIVPLVAMASSFSWHVRKVSLGVIVAGALVMVPASLFLGVYRSDTVSAADIAADADVAAVLADRVDPETIFQMYALAPQFLGFLLEADSESTGVFTASTPLASMLSPLPIIGKPWRDDSGTFIYNRLIYGRSDIIDQIVPCQGELFLSLTIVGLAAFFAALGASIALLQKAFVESRGVFGAYAIQYIAIWCAFLIQGSLGAVSQVLIYFCTPLYIYWIVNRRLAGTSTESSPNLGVAQ